MTMMRHRAAHPESASLAQANRLSKPFFKRLDKCVTVHPAEASHKKDDDHSDQDHNMSISRMPRTPSGTPLSSRSVFSSHGNDMESLAPPIPTRQTSVRSIHSDNGDEAGLAVPLEIDSDNSTKKGDRVTKWVIMMNVFVIVVLVGTVVSLVTTTQQKEPRKDVEVMASQIVQLSQQIGTTKENGHKMELSLQAKLLKEEEENERLRRELLEKAKQEHDSSSGSLRKQEDVEIQKRLQLQIEQLQHDMQIQDRAQVEEIWGPGRHLIKVELEFPPEAPPGTGDNTDQNTFVIETAPLELVPHSVHLFMKMVHAKLWDGCTFYQNPEWGVVAGPHTYREDTQLGHLNHALEQRFRDHDLHQLSFYEFSPEYTHYQYHLGFLGDPGGPHFYIDAYDTYKYNQRQPPCFGKVVAGYDAVVRLINMPYEDRGTDRWMKPPVKIISMTILE